MKCRKCRSENLIIVPSGPGLKLVCEDCLAYQKFLSKSDAKTFEQIKKAKRKPQRRREGEKHDGGSGEVDRRGV